MFTHIYFRLSLIAGACVLCAGLSASPAPAAGAPSAAPAKAASNAASAAHAAGSVEDSLQACLARIPKDATAGQRMIAEQSCRRDEGDRKPFPATGGR